MRAREWYTEFRMNFHPERNNVVRKMFSGTAEIEPARWTEMMSEFLSDLAGHLGYSIVKEFPSFGQKRFDMKWEQDHDEIYIEHENDCRRALQEEVPKLLNVSGKLRVLITYVPLEEFVSGHLANSILEELREKKGGESFEFLLILGTKTMDNFTDWIGFGFFPAYDYSALID